MQGSDEITLYIRPTSAPLTQKDDTGRLPDEIKFVKFSDLSWAPDSEGFFYQVGFDVLCAVRILLTSSPHSGSPKRTLRPLAPKPRRTRML